MALIFADSFAHEATAAGALPGKWSSIITNMNTIQVGRSDAQMFDTTFSPCLLAAGNNGGVMARTLGASYATLIVGAWFRTGNISNAGVIFALVDTITSHVDVRYTAAGLLTVTRNGAVLATSANAIAINTPYHIELRATIHDSTGAYEVRVNGSSVGWIPAATGKDTQNGGNASANTIWVCSRGNNDVYSTNHRYAHVTVCDTSGAVANDFLGPVVIPPRLPIAAGSNTDWAGNYLSNYLNVSETLTDGDGTFNQTATATDKDSFVMAATPSGTVHAVQASAQVRQDAGSGHTVRLFLRISGTNYYGSAQVVAAVYQIIREVWTLNPATSAQWVTADLASIEAGYELVS